MGEESRSSASSWGAPRSVPPTHRTSEKQVAKAEEHVREAKEAQVHLEEKLANGLLDLEALHAEASEEPRQCPQQSAVMEVEPNKEIVRLRALVAELQKNVCKRWRPTERRKQEHWPGVEQILRIVKVDTVRRIH